jgi:hypothetical protein
MITLMTARTVTPCLRALFSDVYTPELKTSLERLTQLSCQQSLSEKSSEPEVAYWRFEVRGQFNELLSRIRRVYSISDLLIFLDDFDTIGNPKGMGDLIKTSEVARFAIVGVADNVGDLVDDHASAGRKLAGSTFLVPVLNDSDLRAIFDRAEAVSQPGMLTFAPKFRDLVIDHSEGFPWFVHLVGFYGVANAVREQQNKESKRQFPLVLDAHDFEKAIDHLLTPSNKENLSDDPYRIDRLREACQTSDNRENRENILFALARCAPGWVAEQRLREMSNMPDTGFKKSLVHLINEGILKERKGPRETNSEYRFTDSIMRLLVKLAAERGPGSLSGNKRA